MIYNPDVLVFRDGKRAILIGPPGSIHTRTLLKAGAADDIEYFLRRLIRDSGNASTLRTYARRWIIGSENLSSSTDVELIRRLTDAAQRRMIVIWYALKPDVLTRREYIQQLASATSQSEAAIERAIETLEQFAEGAERVERRSLMLDERPNTNDIRSQPGVVTGGERLPYVLDQWFPEVRERETQRSIPDTKDIRVAQIPGQIAQKLRDIGVFENFKDFRMVFWMLVVTDPVLSKGWTGNNIARMKSGLAPKVNRRQQIGGGANSVYQLNHKQALEHGGGLYDLDNIEVVGPRFHGEIG